MAEAMAGPMPQPVPSVPASTMSQDIIKARESWAGGNDRTMWRRHWNGGGRHWNGNRHWRGGDWRRSHWRYRHYRGWDGSDAAIFGLGLGLGALGAYNYYDAPPRYYRQRVYRGGNAHVQWCYSRYRSYRAWDNTWQPYNGPRRQCYSPY
jgi:hypothetical protein